MDDSYLRKVVLVGEAGTGKSKILKRYMKEDYDHSYSTTIGVEFGSRTLSHLRTKLQIWDTAGQERFRSITSSYYRGAYGVIIVYDVTNRATFETISTVWVPLIRKMSDDAKIAIVGNKCDLERQVSTSEAQEYCASQGFSFFEVSAKDNINIEAPFLRLVEDSLMVDSAAPPSDDRSYVSKQLVELEPIDPTPNDQSIQRPPSIEDFIGVAAQYCRKAYATSPENEFSPHITSFFNKVSQKPSVWKMALNVGQFEEPKSSIHLRYKAGAEASSVAYELGLERGSMAIAIAFKATDSCDAFRLGEFSSMIKGMLEPLLTSTKSTFSTKIVNEFDGTKILQLLFEVKDEALANAFQELFIAASTTKFEVDLELSERPTRNAPETEFLFFRLNVDTDFKRMQFCFNKDTFAGVNLTSDQIMLLSFFTTIKRVAFSLEFDSLDEFWRSVVMGGQPMEGRGGAPGWFAISSSATRFVKDLRHGPMGETLKAMYKNIEDLAGLHSIQFVFGPEIVLEVKANNFDIFTLLPSFEAFTAKELEL